MEMGTEDRVWIRHALVPGPQPRLESTRVTGWHRTLSLTAAVQESGEQTLPLPAREAPRES